MIWLSSPPAHRTIQELMIEILSTRPSKIYMKYFVNHILTVFFGRKTLYQKNSIFRVSAISANFQLYFEREFDQDDIRESMIEILSTQSFETLMERARNTILAVFFE